MKLHIDKEADALYLRLDDSAIIESEEVAPGVVLDYNDNSQVVGIDLLYLSKRSPNLNLLTVPTFHFIIDPQSSGRQLAFPHAALYICTTMHK